MIYDIIEYRILANNINSHIIKFSHKFEIDYDSQKIKTKRELLIYYIILELLQILQSNKINKPIIVFDSEYNNSLLQFCFKKVSNILTIPIYYCENFDRSKGQIKELQIKADSFYDKNTFTTKKLEKMLKGENFKDLVLKIKQFKLLVKSPQKEHISE
jgi:hypothetical protein